MPKLAKEIAALEVEIADPNLFARDAARFAKALEALEKAKINHDAAETEWLEIEAKREALAAGADD
jgi:ATP-binding cassette subfamily F protein uup